MALDQFLREDLANILEEEMGRLRTEIVFTGEKFDSEALDIARAYMRGSGRQRHALHAIVDSWEH